MLFNNIVSAIKKYNPKVSIKYKDTSKLMKIISLILFFNKRFYTEYVTTIWNTIYFSSNKFIKTHPVASSRILLHEFVHVLDANKYSFILFSIAYLLPQILFLLTPLLLLINWQVALFGFIFLLPLPAYFRMKLELRAYLAEIYVSNKLAKKLGFEYDADQDKISMIKQFKSSSYYYMWIFPDIDKKFNEYIDLDKRPFDDEIFDALDDILNQV